MILVKENDVYKREREKEFTNKETVTFKQPAPYVYEQHEYDWYMTVALAKSDLVKKDRHLLTAELLIGYRMAIREDYQMPGSLLRSPYDHPRNQNTINAIKSYIERIKQKMQ